MSSENTSNPHTNYENQKTKQASKDRQARGECVHRILEHHRWRHTASGHNHLSLPLKIRLAPSPVRAFLVDKATFFCSIQTRLPGDAASNTTTNNMNTEEYLKTIQEKTEDMRRCMTIRNKFERWNEDFVSLDDMSIDQLCEYYESTKEILNKQLTINNN
jgi:hypothetical protein